MMSNYEPNLELNRILDYLVKELPVNDYNILYNAISCTTETTLQRLNRMDEVKRLLRPTEPKWISVDDRLPEKGILCAVRLYSKTWKRIVGAGITKRFQPSNLPDGNLRWDSEFGSTQGIKVTHWMPLPNAPICDEVEK